MTRTGIIVVLFEDREGRHQPIACSAASELQQELAVVDKTGVKTKIRDGLDIVTAKELLWYSTVTEPMGYAAKNRDRRRVGVRNLLPRGDNLVTMPRKCVQGLHTSAD